MRVKTGFARRKHHKKILKATKGYFLGRGKLFRIAHEAYLHAGEYAFAGKKLKKRNIKTLWINRINAGLKQIGVLNYSKFIKKLNDSKIILNRKSLANLAYYDFDSFKKVVEKIITK